MSEAAKRSGWSRRSCLSSLLALPLVTGPLAAPAIAKSVDLGLDRIIELRHMHTGERLRTVFKANGAYVPENLRQIDLLMRDWRDNQIQTTDPALLDLLWDLRRKLRSTSEPVHVLCGYRSPETNAMLRRRSEGVAKNSFHLKGMAIDLQVPGRTCRQVRNAALALGRGGVGYYPISNFVHVDTGQPRSWNYGRGA